MKRNGRENGRNEREEKVDEKEWELEKNDSGWTEKRNR